MKKLFKLSWIAFIPVIAGIALNIIGGQSDNAQLQYIGKMVWSIGVPATLFLLVIIGIILMCVGRLSDNNDVNSSNQVSETEKEKSKIDDVNSSYSYQSHNKKGEYVIGHVANNYKNSTLKKKILGWLFLGFLLGDFALIFVFTALRNVTGIIVCFSIFAGTIFIAVIIKVILERTSMRAKYNKYKGDVLINGKVKVCLLSSVSSTDFGGGSDRRSTTRIRGVVYRVIIVAEGTEYTAYTDSFYETGDSVTFFTRGKRRATIVDEDDLTDE